MSRSELLLWTARRFLFCLAVAILLGSANQARAINELPINETLTAGDTLWVRFRMLSLMDFPSPFNSLGPNFRFSGQVNNFTIQVDIYDDMNAVAGNIQLSRAASTSTTSAPRIAWLRAAATLRG